MPIAWVVMCLNSPANRPLGKLIPWDVPQRWYKVSHDVSSVQPGTIQGALCQNPLRWRHNEHDGVSNHQPHDCLLNRLSRRTSKKTSKLCVTGLCEGNSPGTGEFPAQMASNAGNVSIWWRHHAGMLYSNIRISTMASQITGLSIVCLTISSGADQRKHQSPMSLAFVRGIHQWLVIPFTNGQWRRFFFIWWRHHEG